MPAMLFAIYVVVHAQYRTIIATIVTRIATPAPHIEHLRTFIPTIAIPPVTNAERNEQLPTPIVIVVMQPIFGMILLVSGGILIFFSYFFRQIIKCMHKKIQETDGGLRVIMQDGLENLMVVHWMLVLYVKLQIMILK